MIGKKPPDITPDKGRTFIAISNYLSFFKKRITSSHPQLDLRK